MNFTDTSHSFNLQNDGVKNLIDLQEQGTDNFSNACRICASVTDQVCSIFEEQQDDLSEKINKYLPIKVSKEDGLPQVICKECQNKILAWDDLVKCSIRTKIFLQQLFLVKSPPDLDKIAKHEETNLTDDKWPPRRGSFEFSLPEHGEINDASSHKSNIEKSPCYTGVSPELASDEDDRPLARIATKTKAGLLYNFYTALVNFRNHFSADHDGCSDFSDSSGSDECNKKESLQVDVSNFDDLTHSNMRKDRMDEQTRTELSQAQTKMNGKIYYTCKICEKHLSSTHTYVFHQRIHTGERPCVCHVCGKQFRTPNGLQRHVTETHEKKLWHGCSVCPKRFANSQNLKQHMRIHTGERPFVCSHCGKRFTQSGSLYVHLKTHSENYPHHCAECGAKFRLRSGLTRHRLKHTGERPHVCPDCGKGFKQKHELNTHILAHSDSKPHVCAVCGAAFSQRRALRHHCKRLHQDEGRDVTHSVYHDVGQYEG